jgi:acyl-coenzyme A synthetase/AMP-(fatty) acid ligase
VIESAVIGVPDDRLGSVARAYVVARPESKPSATELTGYLRSRLANFKVPREFVLVDDLPRNASGKVLKRELRDPA